MWCASIGYWLPSGNDLMRVGPDLALIAAIVLILLTTMVTGRRALATAVIVMLGLTAGFLLNWNAGVWVSHHGPDTILEPVPASMIIVDGFTVYFRFLLLIFLAGVTSFWLLGANRQEKDSPEFFTLLLGSAVGMSLMVSTLNLLMIVVAMELASLPSYALAAFDRNSRKGAEAAVKYVIFGSITAATMVYGVSLLYGLFGTLNLAEIAQQMPFVLAEHGRTPLFYLAILAFAVGVGFKISAVPFHFWCPDVFEGARVEVTMWLSVASKAAGLCLLLRVMQTLAAGPTGAVGEYVGPIAGAIGLFAALTCFVGNLSAYRQTSVKRLLAYSSIAHAGYMLMLGAILLRPELSEGAWTAIIAYLLIYMFMNLGAFGVTALVEHYSGSDHIEQFNGLGRRAPWLAVAMAVCLFSLVGLPPLGGFLAKWWLLWALADGGGWLWALVIWACLNTAFSLFYYARIIKHMFLTEDTREKMRVPMSGVAIVQLCAVVLILTGTILAAPIRTAATRYAQGLLQSRTAETLTLTDHAPDETHESMLHH